MTVSSTPHQLTPLRYYFVFILPPWEEIYATDNERKQTFEEAIDVFRRLEEEYMSCGYEVVEVPCISVEERALFVLDRIGMHRKQ